MYSNFPEIFNYTFIQAKIADPGSNVGHAKGIFTFTGLEVRKIVAVSRLFIARRDFL